MIGCWIVIGVHVCLPMLEDGTFDYGRGIIAAVFADGVAIFWFISGFFMFRKYSYQHTLLRTLRTVVLPLLCFQGFLFWQEPKDIGEIAASWLAWTNPYTEQIQLWYIYVYILLMIGSPVVYAFLNYLKEVPVRKYLFMAVSFGFLLWNDLSNNTMAQFSHHTISALVPAMLLMTWGNLFYEECRERKVTPRIGFVAAVVFVLVNIVRLGIQAIRIEHGVAGIWIYFWFTTIGLISACSLSLLCFAIGRSGIFGARMKKLIRLIGAHTFLIYLLHISVYHWLDSRVDFLGLYGELCTRFETAGNVWTEGLYTVGVIGLVFVVSLFLSMILKGICGLLMAIGRGIRNENKKSKL